MKKYLITHLTSLKTRRQWEQYPVAPLVYTDIAGTLEATIQSRHWYAHNGLGKKLSLCDRNNVMNFPETSTKLSYYSTPSLWEL